MSENEGQQHAHGTITGRDSEGNPTSSEFVLDSETGKTVLIGDALSPDAQEFMAMLGMVGDMIEADEFPHQDGED